MTIFSIIWIWMKNRWNLWKRINAWPIWTLAIYVFFDNILWELIKLVLIVLLVFLNIWIFSFFLLLLFSTKNKWQNNLKWHYSKCNSSEWIECGYHSSNFFLIRYSFLLFILFSLYFLIRKFIVSYGILTLNILNSFIKEKLVSQIFSMLIFQILSFIIVESIITIEAIE